MDADKALYEELTRGSKKPAQRPVFQEQPISSADESPALLSRFSQYPPECAVRPAARRFLWYRRLFVSEGMDHTLRDARSDPATLQTEVAWFLPVVKSWRGHLPHLARRFATPVFGQFKGAANAYEVAARLAPS